MVAGHELDRPARPRPRRMKTTSLIAVASCVVPVGDEGVDDEVALGPPRRPLRVGLAQGVVALEGADARHVEDAVGAVGGDDVVGPAVVEGVGVGGDGGADALDDLGVRRRHSHPPALLYRPVGLNLVGESEDGRVAQSGRRFRCRMRSRSRTGRRRSATSTPTSTSSRPSSSGRGCGRWRAGSRRSPSRATSSSTRSSTSRSSCCAPTTCEVRAFQNACRHRGVKVVEGRGTATSGFTCPFHGWCYGQDGANTHIPQRRTFAEHNLQAGDIDLTPVRCELWGGVRVDQPRRRRAAAAAVHRAGRHDPRRVEGRVAAHRVVVRLPAPGELEARPAGVPGAVPRGGGPPAARHPRACATARRDGRRSTRGRSSTPSSSTCAR